PAVGRALNRPWRRPRLRLVGRFREVNVRLGDLAADIRHADPVGCVSARRGTVRDVHARRRSQVAARAGDAVNYRPVEDGVADAGLRNRAGYGSRIRPPRSAVGRFRHQLEGLVALRRDGPDAEHVRGAGAVGPYGAAVKWVALTVVGRRADRVLRPGIAAVG